MTGIKHMTTQTQRRLAFLFFVVAFGWMKAQAQPSVLTLQVLEFNKVDISPTLCLPQISYAPVGDSKPTDNPANYEAVLWWVCSGDGKKITIEALRIMPASSLRVSVQSTTLAIDSPPALIVSSKSVRNLLVGRNRKPGKAEARITFYDTGSTIAGAERQTIVYTILDS